MKNILILGSGAREHALAKKFHQAKCKPFVVPGNDGIKREFDTFTIESQDITDSFLDIYEIIQENNIDLVFAGSEQYLAGGIVDFLSDLDVPVVGPTKAAARIETSKVFAKNLMTKYGIPTAKYQTFTSTKEAIDYLDQVEFPIVIKADGLAAGKGVIIAKDRQEAVVAISDMISGARFGLAGKEIVIEEFLVGKEVSVFAFCDGEHFVSTIFAEDHKQAFDEDLGPNTGGMGAYAPVGSFAPLKQKVDTQIFAPILQAMKTEGYPFTGVLFAGLMINKGSLKVIEFNCRMGDPETQVLLPLLKNNITDICSAIINKHIDCVHLQWKPKYAVNVVLVSKGYPDSYEKGYPIEIDPALFNDEDLIIYFAGIKEDPETNMLYNNGGRVMSITCLKDTLPEAINYAYKKIRLIKSGNLRYRGDIGRRQILDA